MYCISGDFGSVFSSKNYDFSVLLAKSFRNLIRMCFQVTKQWINQNDEILALKQLVNNQRDCLGTKFWETPTPSPRLRVVQRRGKVFSSGLEWSDWSTESGRRQAASRKTEIYMRQRKVRKMRQTKDEVGGGGVPGGNSGILNMIREIPGF